MSDRRRLRRPATPSSSARTLIGHQVTGGCPDCNAYTRYHDDAVTGGVLARIHHEATCPTWAAIRRAHRTDERNT